MEVKILIIDDTAQSRRLLATILKKNTDYIINMAKSGLDIKNMFDRNHYDFHSIPLPGRKIRFGFENELSF